MTTTKTTKIQQEKQKQPLKLNCGTNNTTIISQKLKKKKKQ